LAQAILAQGAVAACRACPLCARAGSGMGLAGPDLSVIVEGVMRGVAGAPRHTVAAAAAAAIRVAAEVLRGDLEPSAVDVETKERLDDIKPQIRMHVAAGAAGLRANVPGSRRRVRNRAAHHGFGAGPGVWRDDGKGTRECKEAESPRSVEALQDVTGGSTTDDQVFEKGTEETEVGSEAGVELQKTDTETQLRHALQEKPQDKLEEKEPQRRKYEDATSAGPPMVTEMVQQKGEQNTLEDKAVFGLANYCSIMLNTFQQEELQHNFEVGDTEKVVKAIFPTIDWLEQALFEGKAEIESKHDELEGIVNPIMTKLVCNLERKIATITEEGEWSYDDSALRTLAKAQIALRTLEDAMQAVSHEPSPRVRGLSECNDG